MSSYASGSRSPSAVSHSKLNWSGSTNSSASRGSSRSSSPTQSIHGQEDDVEGGSSSAGFQRLGSYQNPDPVLALDFSVVSPSSNSEHSQPIGKMSAENTSLAREIEQGSRWCCTYKCVCIFLVVAAIGLAITLIAKYTDTEGSPHIPVHP